MTDLLDLVALSLLPPWCGILIAERLRSGESAGAALRALVRHHWRDEPDKLATVHARAAAAICRAEATGITVVTWRDAAYPPALTTIADPPPVLWVRGQVSSLSLPSVAIVGARAGSPYALSVAERLAHDLSTAGLTIVSGLARGVDSAAHRGALAARACTVASLSGSSRQ